MILIRIVNHKGNCRNVETIAIIIPLTNVLDQSSDIFITIKIYKYEKNKIKNLLFL